MARPWQIVLQQEIGARYTNGEVTLPEVPAPSPPPTLVISTGAQAEGTDYGVIKVEDGKFVLDNEDFDIDFGKFDDAG